MLKILVVVLLSTSATAGEERMSIFGPDADATLPLDDVLRLVRDAGEKEPTVAQPPVGYSLLEVDIDGRIIGDALEATATVQLSILTNTWQQATILRADAALEITELPQVDGLYFIRQGSGLAVVTRTPGNYRFTVGLFKKAVTRGVAMEVAVDPATAAIRRLRLNYDAALFEILGGARRDGEAFVIAAHEGALSVAWKPLHTAPRIQQAVEARPLVEPTVTSADAVVVATLDGRRVSRCLYTLRLQGEQTAEFALPEGQSLRKVYVNGMARPLPADARKLSLRVTPGRQGDQFARVELVLIEQTPPLTLAGRIAVRLPQPGWGINTLRAQLFFPEVFDYHWRGGSLAPSDSDEAVEFTYRMPTPGKRLHVAQELVNAPADAVFDYTVALDGNYFE